MNDLYVLLLAEGKWAIWFCRNLHKFEERNVTYLYIKHIFINNLKKRILSDFKRFSLIKFQSIWGINNVLCKVYDGKVEISF